MTGKTGIPTFVGTPIFFMLYNKGHAAAEGMGRNILQLAVRIRTRCIVFFMNRQLYNYGGKEVMEVTRSELLALGRRIRSARVEASITQEHAATETGISLRFYQMLERGEKGPSLDTLLRLSKVLRVSMDYLLLGEAVDSLSNPIVDIYSQLSPQQREDAAQILKLYQNKA